MARRRRPPAWPWRTEPDSQVTDEELLSYLEQRVAYYKLPSYIVRLKEFPATASGKVRTGQLKELAKQEIEQRK